MLSRPVDETCIIGTEDRDATIHLRDGVHNGDRSSAVRYIPECERYVGLAENRA